VAAVWQSVSVRDDFLAGFMAYCVVACDDDGCCGAFDVLEVELIGTSLLGILMPDAHSCVNK
jgi:hypothetical protein